MTEAQQSHASEAPISQPLTLALLESLSRDLQRALDSPGESEKELRLPSVTCARSWEVDEETADARSCISSSVHSEDNDHGGLVIHKVSSEEGVVSLSSDARYTPRLWHKKLSMDSGSADGGKRDEDHGGLVIHKVISEEGHVSPSSDARFTPLPWPKKLSIDSGSADGGKRVASSAALSTAEGSIASAVSSPASAGRSSLVLPQFLY